MSRWDGITVEEIAQKMVSVSSRYEDWNNSGSWREPNSIWGDVARLSIKSNEARDRKWLYMLWLRNTRDIQARSNTALDMYYLIYNFEFVLK
jgi:hypothetical protein